MIKYYCDICGKEIFDKDDMYKITLRKKFDTSYLEKEYIEKDICFDCATKIDSIIKRRCKD